MVKKAAPGKKLAVKKESVKDLKVKDTKSSKVKGGAGKVSKPATPTMYGCPAC